MNIGEVAERAGLPPKTIRYYEDIGLIHPLRSDNGYRAFQEKDMHKLAFLGRARALGFSIEDCRNSLALYDDSTRESAQVKQIAEEHLTQCGWVVLSPTFYARQIRRTHRAGSIATPLII